MIPVGPATTRRGDPLAILSRDVEWTDVAEILVRPPMVPMDSLGAGLLRDLEGVSTDAVSQSDLAFHALREYVARRRPAPRALAVLGQGDGGRRRQPAARAPVPRHRGAATSPWSSTTRRPCGPTREDFETAHVGRRVDHRPRDARRVRHLVRLRDQRLLRRHRPPGARLGLPRRARQRPGWWPPPTGPRWSRPTPACCSWSAARPSDFENFQRAVTAFPPEVRRYAVIVDPSAPSKDPQLNEVHQQNRATHCYGRRVDQGLRRRRRTRHRRAVRERLQPGLLSLRPQDVHRRHQQLLGPLELRTWIVATEAGNGQKGVPADGADARQAPLLDPRAVAVDSKGNLYIVERSGHVLRVVDSAGKIPHRGRHRPDWLRG